MLGQVEALARQHVAILRPVLIACWTLISVGGLALSARHRGSARQTWLVVAILAIVLTAEFSLDLRYRLSTGFKELVTTLGGQEAYQSRRPVQASLLLFLTLAAIIALWTFLRAGRRMDWGLRLAILGVSICIMGLIVESVSLHQVDAYTIIYWFFRYFGAILAFAGLITGWRSTGTATPARSIPYVGKPAPDDTTPRRFLRIALAIIILIVPELLRLLKDSMPGH